MTSVLVAFTLAISMIGLQAPPAVAAVAPTVTGVSPSKGPLAGGRLVTVTGTDFTVVKQVLFGTKPGTSVKVTSATTLTVIAPSGSAGVVDVRVAATAGTSTARDTDRYTYLAGATISRLSPVRGTTAGGTTVAVTGIGFEDVTAVLFGTTKATNLTVISGTELSVVTPKHAAGRVDVRIISASRGTTAKTSTDRFTFVGTPEISRITPVTGSTHGGTRVKITGTNLIDITTATFGATAGTDLKGSSSTTLYVTAPAGGPGTVNVILTGLHGTSAPVKTARFTYIAPPTITRVSPVGGLYRGGTKVTVEGTGFTKLSKVLFGGVAGRKLIASSKTRLTVVTPKHPAAIVPVQVVGTYGASGSSAASRYAFVAARPTVTALDPAQGLVTGGTRLTVRGANLAAATRVLFGNTPGLDLEIVGLDELSVTAPSADQPGAVSIVVSGPLGSSREVRSFNYLDLDPLPVTMSVTAAQGSMVRLDVTGVDKLRSLTPVVSPTGVTWSTQAGQVVADVTKDAQIAQSDISIQGVGCVNGYCHRRLAITAQLGVVGPEASHSGPVEQIAEPSTDRLEAATALPLGIGTQLADEVTIVTGTPSEPGGRAGADLTASQVGAVVTGGWEDLGVYQLRWSAGQDIDARISELRAIDGVAGVDAGIVMTGLDAGVPVPGELKESSRYTWHLKEIRAPQAWNLLPTGTTTARRKVAVVEEDAVDVFSDELNVVASTGPGKPGDHATHVAGLACAQPDGKGVVGVGLGCPLISSTVSPLDNPNSNADKAYELLRLISAMRDAVGHGASLINLSVGYNPGNGANRCLSADQSAAMRDGLGISMNSRTSSTFRRLATETESKVLYLLAAGNDCAGDGGSPFISAADLPNVVSVAAVNADGHLASFSNWDAEIAAPGGVENTSNQAGLMSTFTNAKIHGDYGTSMATPITTGTAAITWAANPKMTASQVGKCVTSSAGTSTGMAAIRDDHLPEGNENGPDSIVPLISYHGNLPILDAEAAVRCALKALTITTKVLPSGVAGVPYEATVAVSGGIDPYVWSAKVLPSWLSLDTTRGTLTGIPAGVGTYPVSLEVTDDTGAIASIALELNVAEPLPLSNVPLAVGRMHSCAVTSAGTVKCWGANDQGQLGDGTTVWRNTPAPVSGLTGVSAVAAGHEHTCALTTAGGVWCWGSNSDGQLGDGTTTSSNSPVPVTGLPGPIAAIAAGGFSTCALTTGGGVKCWGDNATGQLGDGSRNDASRPMQVVGLTSGITAITVGYGHGCALSSAGGLKCWGSNAAGELGNGTIIDNYTPTPVTGLASGVTAVAVSEYDTCALTTLGGVECWGANLYGQIGNGSTDRPGNDAIVTPTPVIGLSGITTITMGGNAGENIACALSNIGSVKCWGYNSSGQLGDGTTANSSSPVQVSGLTNDITTVTAGVNYSCVLTSTGDAKCWGRNPFKIGWGPKYLPAPIPVYGLTSGIASVTAGDQYSCVITTGGGVKCLGKNSENPFESSAGSNVVTPVYAHGLRAGVASIDLGRSHVCMVTTAGGADCWGYNGYGQLGNGTTTSAGEPVQVTGLISGIIAITAGYLHSCALTAAGAVKCWGANWGNALGDGTTTDSSVPVQVVGLTSGVKAIATGGYRTCALMNTGSVRCWGDAWLGNGTSQLYNSVGSTTPVQVEGLTSSVTSMALSGDRTCVVMSAGAVKCWGVNLNGQLGDGTSTSSDLPVQVTGLTSDVTAISATEDRTCALTAAGSVQCWGTNEYGQLGNGSTTDSKTPAAVLGLTGDIKAISASSSHTCALSTAGGVQCWGSNENGELGAAMLVPADVPGVQG